MERLNLVRRGIGAASRGEFRKIARYICSRVPDSEETGVPSYTVIEEYPAVGWLASDHLQSIQYDTQTDRYRSVVPASGFEIEASEPFDQMRFTILGLAGTESLSVRVRTEQTEEETQIVLARDDVSHYEFVSEFDSPRTAVTVDVRTDEYLSEQSGQAGDPVTVSVPSLRRSTRKPPILILSIDSLRYDRQAALEPLLEELGEDLQIPAEPRTQGHWTPPSHASLFTGTHPGDHEYIGWDDENNYTIREEMTTLGELLAEHGYKSSGVTATTRILPEFGFGRGFDRFKLNRMIGGDWITRETDVQKSVSDVLRWLDEDTGHLNQRICYFVHLFDPHSPYVPPPRYRSAELNYESFMNFRKDIKSKYMKNYNREPQQKTALYRKVLEYYTSSITYTAEQLARIPRELKRRGLFDETLILVLGDHGEEFGERGFYGHNSLYDANIRPFMGIKPPAGGHFEVPDRVDYIDVLPTIAESIGASVPERCQGSPLQHSECQQPRITERIRPDWYNIAVETDGNKGIFTYESNYPRRPGPSVIESGPELEEFYSIAGVREGDFTDRTDDFSTDVKTDLRRIAARFLKADERRETLSTTDRTPAEETLENLEDLGYR